MAGSKFQYDESGGTFFYFLLSFLALILIPASYYLWPKRSDDEKERSKSSRLCRCEMCLLKQNRLTLKEPWKKSKQRVKKALIVLGWLAFAVTAYKVAHLERDYVDWDPFEILQIDRGASQAEIKRAYRKLSLIYHPDKDTGDAKKFLQLTKAHAALTDEEAKKNWEMYGNPDGPGAMSFGIALPSWIVEKENSIWVLGLYALVFMVALPTIVGIWWRRSIKFGEDQVLLNTTKFYYYFINKIRMMNVKKVLMIISGSMEFMKNHNSEIVERPSDNEEVPTLLKDLPSLAEKVKEAYFLHPFSMKARALLHAHLSRYELPKSTLDLDRMVVVKKCPNLIHEFVQCVSQMTRLALNGHVKAMPDIKTLEVAMKLSPMIVQALWDNKNTLLQLPHIKEDMLRHFLTKKRSVRCIRHLVEMPSSDRRALLRTLSDEKYEDVIKVCAKMPFVDMTAIAEVLDDDKPTTITAGSLVTVTVALKRKVIDFLSEIDHTSAMDSEADSNKGSKDEEETTVPEIETNVKKQPVWKKQPKKKGKGSKPKKKVNPKQQFIKKQQHLQQLNDAKAALDDEKNKLPPKGDVGSKDSTDDSAKESDGESEQRDDVKEVSKSENGNDGGGDSEDDENWESIQNRLSNKDKSMETRSRTSHTVHCPYFPEEKQEYWWLYIVDQKLKLLITPPYHVTDLVDEREIPLKFQAPDKVGIHKFSVHLRSDSYLDVDVTTTFKLDVKDVEKDIVPEYGLSEDEKEENDEGTDQSDGITTEDDDDDDD